MDCNYTFPIDSAPYRIQFGAKYITKVYLQSKFGLNYHDTAIISLWCWLPLTLLSARRRVLKTRRRGLMGRRELRGGGGWREVEEAGISSSLIRRVRFQLSRSMLSHVKGHVLSCQGACCHMSRRMDSLLKGQGALVHFSPEVSFHFNRFALKSLTKNMSAMISGNCGWF